VTASRAVFAVALFVTGAAFEAAQAAPAARGRPASAPAHRVERFPIGGMPDGARAWYESTYGVDQLAAQLTGSGALVKFSYRVVDAAKAQALQDRAATPNMIDQASKAVLAIPVMDKVGPLRQAMPAQDGMSYWMTFSNKGSPVKAGHKVSVLVGAVRIDGLIVQ
jgi:hypothetical protein